MYLLAFLFLILTRQDRSRRSIALIAEERGQFYWWYQKQGTFLVDPLSFMQLTCPSPFLIQGLLFSISAARRKLRRGRHIGVNGFLFFPILSHSVPLHSTPLYNSQEDSARSLVLLKCSKYTQLTLTTIVPLTASWNNPSQPSSPSDLLFVHSGPFPRAVTSPWIPSWFINRG